MPGRQSERNGVAATRQSAAIVNPVSGGLPTRRYGTGKAERQGGAGRERIIPGERELRGAALVRRCCRAALIFEPRSNAALPFLESVPEVAAKLKEPESKGRKLEEVVKAAEQTAVLVLVLVY